MASVVALSGRRIDAPGDPPAFPLERRHAVATAIRARLIDADARLLVCSAACGADLLALDAAAGLGIRRRVILPFPVAVFRQRSVTDRPGDWGPLFDSVCEETSRAGDLVILDSRGDAPGAYAETVRAILTEGDALRLPSGLETRLAVAVWEGPRSRSTDVTHEFLDEARRRHWPTTEIPTLEP
jgi:hypothetical protein